MARLLTIEHFRKILRYDPETGHLRRAPHWHRVNIRADGKNKGATIEVAGDRYSAKRVVWAIMTGEWPPSYPYAIRAINNDPFDLRWCNLYHSEQFRVCITCTELQPIDEFAAREPLASGLRRRASNCKKCAAASRAAHRAAGNKYGFTARMKKFGLTADQYHAMVAEQHGVCAICRKSQAKKDLAIDHCHQTGQVRGLLCAACNLGIGHFRDDPKLLLESAKYLLSFAKKVRS